MKRIILLTVLAVLAVTGYAQNANRSGFFVEISTGMFTNPYYNTTKVNITDYSIQNILVIKHKERFSAEVGLGYRFSMSKYFAGEIKAKCFDIIRPYSDDYLMVKIMPGIRYTTPELSSNGNNSIYLAVNAGALLQSRYDDVDDDDSFGVAYDLSVGLNFTTQFYIGLVWSAQFCSVRYLEYTHYDDGEECYTFIDKLSSLKHCGMLGLTLGYRF